MLRWGLWMAPVIYSFLRMAPDPTWYNQDGAVRTGVATLQELDPVARGVPRLEPAGLPGPARLRLVPGADLVRPYGPARRDPGQPLLRRRRPRRRAGRALDRPFRPGALRARRPAPLRDLGAAADPVLHPARRRVGPGLGRGRADAGVGPEPAAAGRRRADRLCRVHRRRGAGGRLHPLARGRAAAPPRRPSQPPCPGRPTAVSRSATAATRWSSRADGRSFSPQPCASATSRPSST